jgi:hypothetical protein
VKSAVWPGCCVYLIVMFVVVTLNMANVPTSRFRKFWSNQIKSLRFEHRATIQHPHLDAAMERVREVLVATAHIAGCTSSSVGGSPKWTLIVQNMAGTRRNLHQLLKGKQLFGALYGL